VCAYIPEDVWGGIKHFEGFIFFFFGMHLIGSVGHLTFMYIPGLEEMILYTFMFLCQRYVVPQLVLLGA
jgi:hypothetical protein